MISSPDFSKLPPEHQRLLQQAKEGHSLDVVPLQELKGGQTGAFLYLASVSAGDPGQVQHFVVKFDHISGKVGPNETERHRLAVSQAISLYNSQGQRVRRLGLGSNLGVVSLTVSALFLWMRGYPDQAHKRASDSIALARKLNHPYSLTYAQFHNGLLNLWLGNVESARESAQAALELAEAHGFQIWRAVSSCLLGAALVGMGSIDLGLALIEQGNNAYRGIRTPPIFWPLLLQLCGGAYGAASKPEDGLRLLNEVIEAEVKSASSAKTSASEFFIMKGDLLLALSADHAAEAESLYQLAVDNAQEVHAPMLELRAATRLSCLWQEIGKTEQARKLLSDAYTKITEGFETTDLKKASALLADLSE